jgi:molecular chaperone DnaK
MLSKDDVDKMVRDAQEHADEDKQRREEVETRNQAEQLTYQAERTLSDLGDKVSAEDRAEVEREVEALREALKGSDIAAVKAGMDALTGTLSRVATAAYQAASPMDGPGQPGSDGSDGAGDAAGEGAEGEPAGAGARSGGSEGATDDAVEGEFKEV